MHPLRAELNQSHEKLVWSCLCSSDRCQLMWGHGKSSRNSVKRSYSSLLRCSLVQKHRNLIGQHGWTMLNLRTNCDECHKEQDYGHQVYRCEACLEAEIIHRVWQPLVTCTRARSCNREAVQGLQGSCLERFLAQCTDMHWPFPLTAVVSPLRQRSALWHSGSVRLRRLLKVHSTHKLHRWACLRRTCFARILSNPFKSNKSACGL